MQSSLRTLEAEGVLAVPLLLLAASELPGLERLHMAQLPASFTYRDGMLPWPPEADARLAELLPQELLAAAEDPEPHMLIYGPAVYRRFRGYWSSFERALAALLVRRGSQLVELSLEAPARSVGRRLLQLLAAQRPARLSALRLRAVGLIREAHVAPRVPLERSGLLLEQAFRELAELSAASTAAATGASPTLAPLRLQQPQAPLAPPCCGLTRLELMACGAEPLSAEALEGLIGLQVLSLRDSCFVWRDRPPDLRCLRDLRRLDLRRCDWLDAEGAPWEEALLLPPGLQELDLAGFSSLTSVDLGPLDRLTSLAELSDITLHPDPSHGTRQLPKPYTQLAALTCTESLSDYVMRALHAAANGCGGGGRRWNDRSDGSPLESESESGTEAEQGRLEPRRGAGASGSGSEDGAHGRRGPNGRHGCGTDSDSAADSGADDGNRTGGVCGCGSAAGTAVSRGQVQAQGQEAGHGANVGGSVVAAAVPAVAPPLVSLTLLGVLPQDVSHLFPALPLLTRLVFAGDAESGTDTEGEGDIEDTGRLVLRCGELPALRELELVVGLLGWGQLALGPATSLTRLVVDDVEFVDVRYIELPRSLRHLAITAWFGLPELYQLSEGPVSAGPAALASALAAATRDRMQRSAVAAAAAAQRIGPGEAAGGAVGAGGGYPEDGCSDDEDADAAGRGGSDDFDTGLDLELLQDQSTDLGRTLEAEVERLLLQRLLPPLTQLRVLKLSWDIVTRRPPAPADADVDASGSGRGSRGGAGAATAGEACEAGPSCASALPRWPFPALLYLEELDVAWMRELPEEGLRHLLSRCPSLGAVTHCNGSRRVVRQADGSWLRRQAGSAGASGEGPDGGGANG
ncbi:hypothetical protein GPECTOR_33g672 [Gonium pectorale]|uniref:Uncharacterized protein n=1 Tax=Gonium pectorale TaxID=33097 RepID=A0A150GEL9_GONPE|nr:hypothetical protein GPECTOR_33g672 [Gonium pectorale]|eukprot:KXZ47790.1 hypothetical protein GPECTOR_33g672 [Gonium pectorale]